MTLDKSQLPKMDARQKIVGGISIVILGVVIWRVVGMFHSGKTPAKDTKATVAEKKVAPPPPTVQIKQPQLAPEQQTQLEQMQQVMQEKYVAVLNELQMLKLSQALAETNKKIATDKLATVKAQKDVVDLLTPPVPVPEVPTAVTQGLSGSGTGVSPNGAGGQQEAITYLVVSVSQLMGKWNAVMSYSSKLYSVFVGDVLPVDGSKVIAIDRYGVVLEKDGNQRTVSLVPVI